MHRQLLTVAALLFCQQKKTYFSTRLIMKS
nr:MAG TPA: hypothetical protein [Caudoviricetes sp.]DAJ18180.1 MAG TPA: hypothetical protein [Podoviridae sp. ctY3D12]